MGEKKNGKLACHWVDMVKGSILTFLFFGKRCINRRGVGGLVRAPVRAAPPHPPKAGRPWGGGYWILHWYWILDICILYII